MSERYQTDCEINSTPIASWSRGQSVAHLHGLWNNGATMSIMAPTMELLGGRDKQKPFINARSMTGYSLHILGQYANWIE